jgi:hypothetical protein
VPSVNNAAQTRQIGNFYNTVNRNQIPIKKGAESLELLGVSNAADSRHAGNTEGMVSLQIETPVASSIRQVSNGNRARSDGRGVGSGVCTAIKRHPWTTGVVLTFTTLAVVAVASRSILDSSSSMMQAPEDLPVPESMVFNRYSPPDDEGVIDICEKAIKNFPRVSSEYVDRTSMSALNAVKAETDRMVGAARSMVQGDEVETSDLHDAARCSGERLKRDKVEVMISDLETMKSGLFKNGGTSVDDPINVLRAEIRARQIDRRLEVLRGINRNLHDVTVALNGKILGNVG